MSFFLSNRHGSCLGRSHAGPRPSRGRRALRRGLAVRDDEGGRGAVKGLLDTDARQAFTAAAAAALNSLNIWKLGHPSAQEVEDSVTAFVEFLTNGTNDVGRKVYLLAMTVLKLLALLEKPVGKASLRRWAIQGREGLAGQAETPGAPQESVGRRASREGWSIRRRRPRNALASDSEGSDAGSRRRPEVETSRMQAALARRAAMAVTSRLHGPKRRTRSKADAK